MRESRKLDTEVFHDESSDMNLRKTLLLQKISDIIKKLKKDESVFRNINEHKVLKTISNILDNVLVDWDNISDKELIERVKKLLALEVMSGLLEGLSPGELKIFDKSVKRRKFSRI